MYYAADYGPNTFVDIFSVDDQGCALVLIPVYLLFDGNPLYHNLSAYLFRAWRAGRSVILDRVDT
jgi:hypothetical protein